MPPWYYHEDNFDQPEMRERLTLMAKLLRLNPHSRSDRMAILRAIANHYDDLLNMPPRPKDGQRVVADAVTYDSETGNRAQRGNRRLCLRRPGRRPARDRLPEPRADPGRG